MYIGTSSAHSRAVYLDGNNNDKVYITAFGVTTNITDSVGNAALEFTKTTNDTQNSASWNGTIHYNDSNDDRGNVSLPLDKGTIGYQIVQKIYDLKHPTDGHQLSDNEKKNLFFTVKHTCGEHNDTGELAEFCRIQSHPNSSTQNNSNSSAESPETWTILGSDVSFYGDTSLANKTLGLK